MYVCMYVCMLEVDNLRSYVCVYEMLRCSDKLDLYHPWKGVILHRTTERVQKLILSDNNLTGQHHQLIHLSHHGPYIQVTACKCCTVGTIPPEISDLEELIEIDFRCNRLTGNGIEVHNGGSIT